MLRRKPRVNVYICDYNCLTKTVDVDKGVTPAMIPCTSKPRPDRPIFKNYLNEQGVCKGTARSMFYPTDYPKDVMSHVTHEWYRPTDEEIEMHVEKIASKADPNTRNQIRKVLKNGPLMMRERTDAKPVYHSIIPSRVRIWINRLFYTLKGMNPRRFVFK